MDAWFYFTSAGAANTAGPRWRGAVILAGRIRRDGAGTRVLPAS